MIRKIYALDLGRIGGDNLGVFGNADLSQPVSSLAGIVSSVVGVMTLAAAIWTLFQILVGGISWITAGGDKGKLETARNKITNALIGLVIVVAGWAILALAGQFLGLSNIMLNNPGEIIDLLNPVP